jgi:5'-nucleotidase
MNVLLTNDDGIQAEGIWALYKCFAKQHIVTVVAPDRERSAVGHGITLDEPLRTAWVELNGGNRGYAVSGTPADCIKLAILEILDTKPDVVISGINPGANVGININYSGTVAAAKEAALYGVAAIAVSMKEPGVTHYDEAAAFIKNLTEKVMQNGLPAGTFLNVNFPNTPIQKSAGVLLSRQGLELYSEYFDKRTDPRNRTYYWQGFELPNFDGNLDSDGTALHKNFISITPIKCDMTDYRVLEDLEKWEIDI